ncbi:hypothetical protein ABW20_dc0100880 [Dactylellina cionopaga]|nr:hypothetical protein ABW20_dc0100880 [Dactylellina cionopaga]
MKFTATALTTVVGLTALVAAIPQGSITAAPSVYPTAAPGYDSAYSATLSCITNCGAGNVYCQAQCQGLPTPDKGSVDATHDCVAACPPGGDAEKNLAWADCQQKCVAALYYTESGSFTSYVVPTAAGFSSDVVAPAETTGTSPAEQTPVASAGAKTTGGAVVSGGSNNNSGSKTTSASSGAKTTGPSAPSQSPNAGSYNIVNMPMLGAFGLVLAAFAL